MSENKTSSAFIWYHAASQQENTFQSWIDDMYSQFGIQGKLYKRLQNKKTTFMEVFEHVDYATIKKIEQLATKQGCFKGIERRCELFERIKSI